MAGRRLPAFSFEDKLLTIINGPLTEEPVGMWEPTYDPEVWRGKRELHLFVQVGG